MLSASYRLGGPAIEHTKQCTEVTMSVMRRKTVTAKKSGRRRSALMAVDTDVGYQQTSWF